MRLVINTKTNKKTERRDHAAAPHRQAFSEVFRALKSS